MPTVNPRRKNHDLRQKSSFLWLEKKAGVKVDACHMVRKMLSRAAHVKQSALNAEDDQTK